MTIPLDDANAALRDAVSERLDRKMHRDVDWDRLADRPYIEHLLEQQRLKGDGITHEQPVTVAEQTLRGAIEAVRDRHTKYGPPREHFGRTASLVNAAFGTTFSASDWALVMVLDKVARLRGPMPTTDGGIDIAGYASCYEECRCRG
jgi:cytochrome c-type biogenesis protein CcmH/NrfG